MTVAAIAAATATAIASAASTAAAAAAAAAGAIASAAGAAAGAVTGVGTSIAGAAGLTGAAQTVAGGAISGAMLGSATGGISSAIQGENIGKGVLMGAATGAAGGALAGGVSAALTPAAEAATASVSAAEEVAYTAAQDMTAGTVTEVTNAAGGVDIISANGEVLATGVDEATASGIANMYKNANAAVVAQGLKDEAAGALLYGADSGASAAVVKAANGYNEAMAVGTEAAKEASAAGFSWETGDVLNAGLLAVGTYQAYAQDQQARAQAELLKAQARQGAAALNAEADNFTREAMGKDSEIGEFSSLASEELRQHAIAMDMAANEQIKGERAAAQRGLLLSSHIGSLYANYAANGFLVDGRGGDTFGDIIRSATTEGQSDISEITEGANFNMWSLEENARSKIIGARNSLAGANNAAMQAQSLMLSARDSREAAAETLANGYAAARDARRAGRRAAFGTLAQTGVNAFMNFGKTHMN